VSAKLKALLRIALAVRETGRAVTEELVAAARADAMVKRWRASRTGRQGGYRDLAMIGSLLRDDERLATGPVADELARRLHQPRMPLDVAVTGTIAGSPWRDTLDLGEMDHLMIHLGTACFIVIAYLTGMRPGEVLGLQSGCCPEPDDDGRTRRHLIRGKTFKTARDEHGNHDSAGVERDVPWVAITPVVNAIRALERMVPPGSLLFDKAAHDVAGRRQGTGSLKLATMRNRVEAFIAWANAEATVRGLPAEVVPLDPRGAVGTASFRRSLAWHIARRPGGLVALAIQYGHLRTAFSTVTDGYGSRSRSGIHDLIDVETARAVADTVIDLNDHLENGGGVSGPAARRAIKAAAKASRFAGTVITAATAKRLIANEDAMIYDNPQAFVLCHYKRAQALCHRDGIRDTPALDRCVPGCGNIIRTDEHAVQLRERAGLLDKRAAFAARPIGDRLRANASRLRDLADTHDRTRSTLKDAT
jgi:integrase